VQLNHGPWSLLAPAVGEPLSRGPLSPNVARELGHFVKNLHQLPTSGYGRLFEEDNGFTGQDRCPIDGARNRWRWASSLFPLDGHELSGQPIALAAPDLVERLTDISEPILDIIRQERAVINHSDLSGEHIFISGDSLSAVIDFGSSFIGASAWEFATLAYYHGWKTLGIILQGYSADHNTRQLLLTKSRYLAVALGIYKFHKALTQKRKGSKIRRRLQFVRDALATIHG
jgi:hypothetical protein